MLRRLIPVLLVVGAVPGSAVLVTSCATPASATPPPVSGSCTGIRPGAAMVSPAGCTMNFVFTSSGTDRYIGTAAHCVSAVGQSVSLVGTGVIGTVAYWGWGDSDGTDFALVKVSAAKLPLVNPAMCHWGGPTAPAVGYQEEPVSVVHFGHGIGAGSAAPTKARRGLGYAWGEYWFYTATAGTPGDSGSAVMSADGLALGVLVTVGPFGNTNTRLDVAVERASRQMGIPLTLLTAPLA